MLLRTQIRRGTLGGARLLHTSRPSLGFMDWFNFKKSEEAKKQKKPVEKAKDLNEVISDAEAGKVEVKTTENIEFIGVRHPKGYGKGKFRLQTSEDIEAKIKELDYPLWLNEKKVANLSELQNAVVDSLNEVTGSSKTVENIKFEDVKLDDLQFRFDITTKIQEKSGLLIPDQALTDSSDLQQLITYVDFNILGNKTYFQKIMAQKTLDINDLQFTSPNISIQPPVNSKQRKETYANLLESAKKAQEEKAKKLIDESRV